MNGLSTRGVGRPTIPERPSLSGSRRMRSPSSPWRTTTSGSGHANAARMPGRRCAAHKSTLLVSEITLPICRKPRAVYSPFLVHISQKHYTRNKQSDRAVWDFRRERRATLYFSALDATSASQLLPSIAFLPLVTFWSICSDSHQGRRSPGYLEAFERISPHS